MLYRNAIQFFSHTCGLACSLPIYIATFLISESALKLALSERVFFKNRFNTHAKIAHATQVHTLFYKMGSSLGCILDTLTCGLLQPFFWAAHRIQGEEQTQAKINAWCELAARLNQSFIKNLQSFMHLVFSMLFVSYSLMVLKVVVKSGALPAGSHLVLPFFLANILTEWYFLSQRDALKKKSRITQNHDAAKRFDAEVLESLHRLHSPTGYSIQNLEEEVQTIVTKIEKEKAYVDDHLRLDASWPHRSQSKISSENQNVFYQQGLNLGKGYRDGLDAAQHSFLKQGAMSPAANQKAEPLKTTSSKEGKAYTLLPFWEIQQNVPKPSKEELKTKREAFLDRVIGTRMQKS